MWPSLEIEFLQMSSSSGEVIRMALIQYNRCPYKKREDSVMKGGKRPREDGDRGWSDVSKIQRTPRIAGSTRR